MYTAPDIDEIKSAWHEECGVVGLWTPGEDTVKMAYLSLFALQHRGQESAGIAVTNGLHIDMEKGLGLMRDVFSNRMPTVSGHAALGHVRYSVREGILYTNIQPIFAYFSGGFLSLAHNGSLTNAQSLRHNLEEQGCIFQSTTDSETILNLIARAPEKDIEDKIEASLSKVEGAYSLVLMSSDKLIGVRDPRGFRPLCLGKTPQGGYLLASETVALDAVKAEFIRDVLPGEMLIIDKSGVRSRFMKITAQKSLCVFEFIYFARPDSVIDGMSVWKARHRMGRELAREFKGQADIVVPVPDTGITAALGFSAESGLPYVEGLIKNRYVGRTFIQQDQDQRAASVEMKLNTIKANIKGQRVILIDDSLVRGTTSASLVSLIRKAGAKEVHMCISSPPVTHPCFYGIDTSCSEDLIAATKSIDEIKDFLEADGLCYLSHEGLMRSVWDEDGQHMCNACVSGRYPTSIDEIEKD